MSRLILKYTCNKEQPITFIEFPLCVETMHPLKIYKAISVVLFDFSLLLQIQKPVDPFEYLRNMPAGASMEPIIDPHSFSSTRQSVSYPVYLMKVMPGSHKYVAGTVTSQSNLTYLMNLCSVSYGLFDAIS